MMIGSSSFNFLVVVASFQVLLGSWGTTTAATTSPLAQLAQQQERKKELRNTIRQHVQEDHRQLVSGESTAACFGDSVSFETESGEAVVYSVAYPTATNGASYTCKLTCTATSTVVLTACVSAASSNAGIDYTNDCGQTEVSGGCGSGVSATVTANTAGTMIAFAVCDTSGCADATMTCSQGTGRRFSNFLGTIMETIRTFRGAGDDQPGHQREREEDSESSSESSEDDRRHLRIQQTTTSKHDKYIRRRAYRA